VVAKRSHSVLRVYAHDADCSDIMLLGSVDMGLANGRSVEMEFAARMVIARDAASSSKLELYQVWAV